MSNTYGCRMQMRKLQTTMEKNINKLVPKVYHGQINEKKSILVLCYNMKKRDRAKIRNFSMGPTFIH